ncbi:MAG: heavy metal translocating P-type ATPase, partial [Variibacter sp.]
MSCCAPGVEAFADVANHTVAREELLMASRDLGDGLRQTDLSVPTIHCGGCIQKIERTLGALPDVAQARVNLTAKRVAIRWRGDTPPSFIEALNGIGYEAHLYDPGAETDGALSKELVRALAVAGFAASNIMLLSVSIWSGATPETRDLFHWISALIALPALAYSGRIFFRSAWSALRHGQTNMDVPISLGVLLAFGLSLYETANGGAHAYFDASVSLLFFLLIGRALDHLMRERARTAVKGLARLAARGALVLQDDGTRTYLPVNEIAPGMTILLAAGERVPVDGRVVHGRSDIDRSLVSGESLPQTAAEGSTLQAGTLNLTGPLTIVATAAAQDSFLAEMMRMMEAAEGGRSLYRRVADRAARLYAPVVHLAALMTCIGWLIVSGDLHRALTVAIAVLIITCPCALGLAVPMVQAVAARRLFEKGIMVKDGSALERLAEIDTVIFDKTGTLTVGTPQLVGKAIAPEVLALAGALAAHSRHPYSRALAAAAARLPSPSVVFDEVS